MVFQGNPKPPLITSVPDTKNFIYRPPKTTKSSVTTKGYDVCLNGYYYQTDDEPIHDHFEFIN